MGLEGVPFINGRRIIRLVSPDSTIPFPSRSVNQGMPLNKLGKPSLVASKVDKPLKPPLILILNDILSSATVAPAPDSVHSVLDNTWPIP